MIILGLNSAYHESSVALLADGELLCFIEEERVNRIKHGKPALIDNPDILPEGAIAACLAYSGLDIDEIDVFSFSFAKEGRLSNIGLDEFTEPEGWGTLKGEELFHARLQSIPSKIQALRKKNRRINFNWVGHHLAHAASAYLCSPYDEAAVLVIDGIGEIDSITAFHGIDRKLSQVFKIPYPHSIGLLWEKLSVFLGFTEYDACKVMGLGSYGDPNRFSEAFEKLVKPADDGTFIVDNARMRFRSGGMDFLESLLGPMRKPEERIEPRHSDIAAALQTLTDRIILGICRRLKAETGAVNLCMAGGTALNCVTNSLIQRESGFANIYIQPAANDAGTALGAALHSWCNDCGGSRKFVLKTAYYGPDYDSAVIEPALRKCGLLSVRIERPELRAAELISEGKLVAWFQGRMEMGPRALGNRSLLADPSRSDMRDILNRKVKHREDFRPFAPSVLRERATEWFHLPAGSTFSDFMLGVYKADEFRKSRIPAVIHVDGTSRIQTLSKESNPLFHALISAFNEITGIPMVLNTSFNDSEPIVMTPEHALKTFLKTGIDALFLGNHLVLKSDVKVVNSDGTNAGLHKAA